MGKAVIHAGQAGNGQAAKICNNMLLAIHMIGTCEAFEMAKKLGLDPQTFYDISSVSSGQCWSMTSYCPVPGVGPTTPADNQYQGAIGRASSRASVCQYVSISVVAVSLTNNNKHNSSAPLHHHPTTK